MKSLTKLQCVALIVGSLFLSSALGFTVFRGYRYLYVKKLTDKEYVIDTIIQTGPEKGALLSVFLSQILDLSIDKPQNFFLFDEKQATEKLSCVPMIQSAVVRKERPNRVYIDYSIRQPIANIGDFTNIAIDLEKKLFPLVPFYSPKRLPEFYLGIKEYKSELSGKEIDLAFSVFFALKKAHFERNICIEKIDVSNAFSNSYGKREIVVVLVEEKRKIYLRLSPRSYFLEINNYLSMNQQLQSSSNSNIDQVVDLRISKLAYMEEYPRSGVIGG